MYGAILGGVMMLRFGLATPGMIVLLLAALPLYACGSEFDADATHVSAVRESQALVDNRLWLALGEDGDPFRDDRPEPVDCPSWAHAEENGALEIDTGTCNYATLSQPALVSIEVGDTIHLSLWHDALIANEPGRAHVALSLGNNEPVWEIEPEIPSTPQAYSPRIPMKAAYAKGTPVLFHLHNHGSNNWRLLSVSVERAAATPSP